MVQRKNKYIFKIRWSTERFVFFEFIYFVLICVLRICITYVLYICMFPACCFRQRTFVAQGLLNGVLNETWTEWDLNSLLFPVYWKQEWVQVSLSTPFFGMTWTGIEHGSPGLLVNTLPTSPMSRFKVKLETVV